MLEERLNCHSFLSVNNDITKLLTCEKSIEEYITKKAARNTHPGNSPIHETRMLRARVGCFTSLTPRKLARARSWNSSLQHTPLFLIQWNLLHAAYGNTAQVALLNHRFFCFLFFCFLCPRSEESVPDPSGLSLPIAICSAGGGGFPCCLCPSLRLFSCHSLWLWSFCSCSVSPQVFFRRNCSTNRCDLVCSWRTRVESSYDTILNWNFPLEVNKVINEGFFAYNMHANQGILSIHQILPIDLQLGKISLIDSKVLAFNIISFLAFNPEVYTDKFVPSSSK